MGKGSSPRSCFSQEFRDNYDEIFPCLTGEQWAAKLGITVQNLDNWSYQDYSLEKISKQDFWRRIVHCTISGPRELIKQIPTNYIED